MALATAYLHEIARLHRVSFGALLPWVSILCAFAFIKSWI